ncbi:uncharacterized protein LOC124323154 [Daphnia pulicaria]|uniref:uncharacterized protein LOC124323154 n=1 Tax=Daphnia pulicaria TaxID=35523 RepID=UPI001EEA7347|nr:uncharacterized protein LOC124323154 [Daphnia pulicaria]
MCQIPRQVFNQHIQQNEELETFFSQERVNDKSTTSEIETAYIHDDPQEIFDEDILSSAIGDLNFEEPDSDVEFDDTQSQAAEESDDDSWSDEELNSTETSQLQLPEKTQEDVVIDNLRQWASSTQVPYIHVSSLLKVLHKDAGYASWEISHFDLEASLVRFLVALQSKGIKIPSEIKLLFNADGLPLSKSGSNEFWPILVRIQGYDFVFGAGIYQGRGKPADVNVYLKFFAADIHQLRRSGLQFEGQTITVSVCGMSSDAPATAYILNIKGHNAFHGCRICTTRGSWTPTISKRTNARSGGRVTFPEINAPLRSDSSFRKRENIQHHNKNQIRSVVEDIIDDLTADVHLDYMHLVCIGCFKKLLNVFFCHPFDNIRLSPASLLAISAFREHVRQYIPSDFARKPRSAKDLPRWKATELRLDLLYLCPVIYKCFITKNSYDHLMLLHVSIRLLLERDSCQADADYANELLRLFVQVSSQLYGPAFVTFNIHSLIHLAKGVKKHGSLEDTSAFCFENKLQVYKNMVRPCGRSLEQLVRRIDQECKISVLSVTSRVSSAAQKPLVLKMLHFCGPILPGLLSGKQYKQLVLENTILTNSLPDNCVIIEGNHVVLIANFVWEYEKLYVIGRRYLHQENYFSYPLPSSNIYEIVVSQLSHTLESFEFCEVKYKCIRIPTFFPETGSYFVSKLLNLNIN